MEAVVIILAMLLFGAGLTIALLHQQLRRIDRQLQKRLTDHTRRVVSLELFDRELNRLAASINRALQAEETARIRTVRESRQLREMIADLSHDLRTPLTVIKGYLQLLAQSGLNARQNEMALVAQKHADQLGVLIEHFFEYAYLLHAEETPKPTAVNLSNLTAECLADAVSALEQKQLDVQFDTAPAVYALADREMLVRILQNLIRNCCQHAEGTIRVNVRQERRAVLSFGNRVAEGEHPDAARLFDQFYTADPARARSGGLGLTIVKLLAERMNGQVGACVHSGMLEIRVELPVPGSEVRRFPGAAASAHPSDRPADSAQTHGTQER